MNSIQITIYGASGSIVKSFKPKSVNELTFHHEMFNGTRYFDFSQQLSQLLEQNLNHNQQQYSLFCSYTKFGETQQERADFSVLINRV